jgi:hypothetical protein
MRNRLVPARVARIEIFDDLPAGEAAWRTLVALGTVASPYQNYDWVRLWHRHVNPHAGMAPCLMSKVGNFNPDEWDFSTEAVADSQSRRGKI